MGRMRVSPKEREELRRKYGTWHGPPDLRSVKCVILTLLDSLDAAEEELSDAQAVVHPYFEAGKKAEAQRDRLRERVRELEQSAAMACETPPDGCDCAGCSYAAEVYEGGKG